jgi:hypothetical protein
MLISFDLILVSISHETVVIPIAIQAKVICIEWSSSQLALLVRAMWQAANG